MGKYINMVLGALTLGSCSNSEDSKITYAEPSSSMTQQDEATKTIPESLLDKEKPKIKYSRTIPHDGIPTNAEFQQTLEKAENGDLNSQFSVANLYDSGLGIPVDRAAGTKWMRNAAEGGHIEAQYFMGLRYVMNIADITPNHEKAFKWTQKASKNGHIKAQHNLGTFYFFGTGTPIDLPKAAYWFTKAAEGGNAQSQNSIAVMYSNGQGVEVNPEKEVYWLQKAAQQREPYSLYLMAKKYKIGDDVSINLDESYKLAHLAEKLGVQEAKQLKLSVLGLMSDEQRAAIEMETNASQVYWRGKPWQPLIISKGENLFYHLPVESGFVSLSFDFPISKRDSLALQVKPKRYYYLFAALHDPFQNKNNNLSDAQVRQYFDIILHANDKEVEAFIDKLDKNPNSRVRYLADKFENK